MSENWNFWQCSMSLYFTIKESRQRLRIHILSYVDEQTRNRVRFCFLCNEF